MKIQYIGCLADPGLTVQLDANGPPDGFAASSFFFPCPVGSSAVVNTPPPTDFGSIVKKLSEEQKKKLSEEQKLSEGTYLMGRELAQVEARGYGQPEPVESDPNLSHFEPALEPCAA